MTLQTHSPAPDPAWIAELTAELESYGYKVTKARAPRATSTESAGRADGAEPVKAPRSGKASHDACAAHYRVPGLNRPVCVTREGATYEGTTELVGPEWTDTERVLAFAVDVGARVGMARAMLDDSRRIMAHHSAEHSRPELRTDGCPECRRTMRAEARDEARKAEQRARDEARRTEQAA